MNLFGNICLDRMITVLNMCISCMKSRNICSIVIEGITHETRATLESMCYGGLCSLCGDDLWDLFEFLASY